MDYCDNKTERHEHHEDLGTSSLKTSAHATLHCLTGCVIGEVAGLMIGVSIGLSPWVTMGLATALAFVVGISLAILPIMKDQHLSFKQAFQIIWIGEAISIAVMEVVMNGVDYWMGGVTAASILEPIFWTSLLAAIPAGYLAAWPVNHWLLRKALKNCH